MKIAGAILAGGSARRFGGRAKGLVRLAGGESIVSRLLRVMGEAGLSNPVICSGTCNSYSKLGVRTLPDQRLGVGPLAGIQAALSALRLEAEAVQFLPCDLPLITAVELRSLQQCFLAKKARVVFANTCTISCHALCSIVHIDLLDEIGKAMEAGRWSVHEMWSRCEAQAVHFAQARRFGNVNTPADLIRLCPDSPDAGEWQRHFKVNGETGDA
jgi:molybdopterin-guanine dinucleotide biosynthesis protein A